MSSFCVTSTWWDEKKTQKVEIPSRSYSQSSRSHCHGHFMPHFRLLLWCDTHLTIIKTEWINKISKKKLFFLSLLCENCSFLLSLLFVDDAIGKKCEICISLRMKMTFRFVLLKCRWEKCVLFFRFTFASSRSREKMRFFLGLLNKRGNTEIGRYLYVRKT